MWRACLLGRIMKAEDKLMANTTTDISSLLKDIPPGAWVAISEKEEAVLAYGPDPQEVFRKALEHGEREPLITRVPERAEMMFF
jgi:Family of unknown function (DUF5678)